jgi:Flp pilus assembly protein TadD
MTELEVNRALDEAAIFQAQSKWPEALEAAKRAEGFLAGGAGESLRQRVWEQRKDVEMVLRLEQIWLRSRYGKRDLWLADASYAAAFREYGIDVDALEPAEAARRIRSRAMTLELAATLDYWADTRQGIQSIGLKWDGWPDQADYHPEANDASWKRLSAVARAADPDAWRDQVRAALYERDREKLKKLVASPRFSELRAQTLSAVARHVETEHMTAALRRAQLEHPDNFIINGQLAWVSRDRDEKIRFFTAALALRPRAAGTAYHLARHLSRRGKLDEAIALYRKAITFDPDHPDYVASYLGVIEALQLQGKLQEANAEISALLAEKPSDAKLHNNIAWNFATSAEPRFRDARQAVDLASRAVQLAPNEGAHWNTMGAARYRAGDCQGACAALEKSMNLRQGGDSYDWFFLAMACWQLGERDKARLWYKRAVEWMGKHQPTDDELRRFCAEAAGLLGVSPRADREGQDAPPDADS